MSGYSEGDRRCMVADGLGVILDEILSVKKSIREVPADAFGERVELRERLLGLQAATAAASEETTSASTLLRYVEQLERRRDALLDQRIDPSWQDGSMGGMGITARQTAEFNRRIDVATDLPALEEEIAQIRARLTNGQLD
jgi:hypothetical protein